MNTVSARVESDILRPKSHLSLAKAVKAMSDGMGTQNEWVNSGLPMPQAPTQPVTPQTVAPREG